MTKSANTCLALALAGAAIAMSACGDSANDDAAGAAVPAATRVADTSEPPPLDQFLMRDGEQPGFRRVESAQTETGIDEFLSKGPPMKPADERLLRRSGQLSTTYQPTSGPKTAGVTSVTLFATEDGARQWMARELDEEFIHQALPDVKVKHFDVAGIPGARGWTTADPGVAANQIGNVLWIQGRCMLILGNQGPGPIAEPLSTGARAIQERTQGRCP
jgi:hypothetical protein